MISIDFTEKELAEMIRVYKSLAERYHDLKIKPEDFLGYTKIRNAYTEIQRNDC